MITAPDRDGRRLAAHTRSAGRARRIRGIALMLLGVALMSYGAHLLVKTGTCSGTGYVYYGPVPKCGRGEPLYIMSAVFVGPVTALVGWLLARALGWLWPTFCVGVGAGLITVGYETTATPDARAFGFAGGSCLVALAALSAVVRLRERRRPNMVREAAGPGTTVLATTLAPPPVAPAAARAVAADQSDPLDTIAKLSQLRVHQGTGEEDPGPAATVRVIVAPEISRVPAAGFCVMTVPGAAALLP